MQGIDHIPLAVADLDSAADRYRKLGFVIKPGRLHENGIRNQHIKFVDGTEIELISVSDARDSLTAEYLRHLAFGDGPAFIGFYAPDITRLTDWFAANERTFQYDGGLLTFLESDELRYIFFGDRNLTTTDRPEHFEHPNGAQTLIGVWIAGYDLSLEQELLSALGALIAEEEVNVPETLKATVFRFQQAEVVFLPESKQLVPGRRIVGAVIQIGDIDALDRILAETLLSVPPVVKTAKGRSIFIPPSMTHGIWLEFRQQGD